MCLVKRKPFSAVLGGIAEGSSSPPGGRDGESCRVWVEAAPVCERQTWGSAGLSHKQRAGGGSDGGDELGRWGTGPACKSSLGGTRRELRCRQPKVTPLLNWLEILGFSFTWGWGMGSAALPGLCRGHPWGQAGTQSSITAGGQERAQDEPLQGWWWVYFSSCDFVFLAWP